MENRSYQDLVQLAQACAMQASFAASDDAASKLWCAALEYQRRAAALDSGKLLDIELPPSWFKK